MSNAKVSGYPIRQVSCSLKWVVGSKSPTLSGASKTQDKSLGDYEVFRSSAVLDRWRREDGSKLATEEDCRMAMVLIALMSGGDYAPEGFETIGE